MKRSVLVRLFIVGILMPAFLLANTPVAFGAENLLQNPSVETGDTAPDGWSEGQHGDNAAQFTYPVSGLDGTNAVSITMTAFASGDAKWYPAEITAKPSTTYIFSDVYTANVATSYDVQYRLSSGELVYIFVGAAPATDTPTRNEFAFTTPADAVAMTVFHLIDRVGTLTTDAFSVTEQESGNVPEPVTEPIVEPNTPTIADVTPAETVSGRGLVTLAMDDGSKGIYDYAIPILNARGLKSTQYITSGFLDTQGYMATSDVLAMQAAGHEIGGHAKTHPDLTIISPEQAYEEISGGRDDLLALGATPVATFTYPFGEFNESTKQMVRDAGFVAARSVNAGFNTSASDRYALLDQHVESGVSVETVRQWIDQAIADDTWLILEFHQQAENCNGNEYCNTPETFTAIADYLVEKGVSVVTLKEGVEIMGL